MIERAGIWRRGIAAGADLILAQILFQSLVALLFAVSGGHVTSGIDFYSSCEPALVTPSGVTLPTGFIVTSQSLCTSRFFAPTQTLYVARHQDRSGTSVTTTSVTAAVSPDGRSAIRVLGLDALFYPVFILLRWASDRFAGGSLGRRLVRIAVADVGGTAEGAALARLLARRYARFAWPYAPGTLMLALVAVSAAAFGTIPATLQGLSWIAASGLVGAAHLTAGLAIFRHQDAFYDAPCGTIVAPRLEIARARDMNPDALVPDGPGPLRDLAGALWVACHPLPWVTLGLSGLLSIVYMGEVLLPWPPASATGLSADRLMAWGGMDRELAILLVQPYRLFTAIFLHGSLVHLVVNVTALLIIGFLLEEGLGPILFGAVFLLGGLAGSLASIAVSPPEMISVGASGAILALFAAALPLSTRSPRGNQRLWLWAWPITICIPAVTPGVALPGMIMVDRADHAGGEIAGLILGILIAVAWRRGAIIRPSRRVGQVAVAGLACIVGATIAVGGVRAPMQGANLVPHGEEPADDAEWERRAPVLLARYPHDPRVVFGLALKEADDGSAALAVADLDTAIAEQRKLSPVHADGFRFSAHAMVGAKLFGAGDLDEAIAQYSSALKDRSQAALYRQRGISEFYRGQGDKAVSDLRQALTVDRKEGYSVLWLSIVAGRSGLADPIAATAKDADLDDWPGQLIRYFDGTSSLGVADATAGLLDLASDEHRVCEVKFYAAERLIMHGEIDAARPLLKVAASTCPKTFIEYRAALEELAGHGGLPAQ